MQDNGLASHTGLRVPVCRGLGLDPGYLRDCPALCQMVPPHWLPTSSPPTLLHYVLSIRLDPAHLPTRAVLEKVQHMEGIPLCSVNSGHLVGAGHEAPTLDRRDQAQSPGGYQGSRGM